jgi:glycosyltransferase involved in cell wall biosynthesis
VVKIIGFPYHDWRKGQAESFRTRDGHLLEAFAEHPDVESVLVIDRPVSRAERLMTRRSAFVRGSTLAERTVDGRTARLTRVGPVTTVLDVADPGIITPLAFRRGWWFDVFDDPRTLAAIGWGIAESGSGGAGVIAWVPTVAGAVAAIHPRHFVFDSLDNWLTHPTLRRHATRAIRSYRQIGSIATTVFVPSEATKRQLDPFMPRIEVLPNGVDPRPFVGTHSRPPDLPPAPVVGYLGKLGIRLDGMLIRDVATRLPGVTFVFVGPILQEDSTRPFANLENVVLLGDRRYEDVPAYLAHFDVAWIPHRVGEGETGGDLIKKYEYWAAGRQVVSTSVGGIDAWAHQVHLATTADGAAALLSGILAGTIAPTATVVPTSRTWAAIADRIVQSLASADPRISV